MKLATAAQIRALDHEAIHRFGIPGLVLMENAGRGTVDRLIRRFGPCAGRKVVVFVGPGNNGGDGLVIARHLHQRGALSIVCLLVEAERLTGDAAVNFAMVRGLALDLRQVAGPEALAAVARELADTWLVVDALFGTGLTRALEGHFGQAVALINSFDGPVVAVDVPSGLNSDTGQCLGPGVRADLTVTYGLAKPGLFIPPGSGLAGRVEVEDIGIPAAAESVAGPGLETLEPTEVRTLLPPRLPDNHKGTFGHLLVVAGSLGKIGAALLCARAGLRSGAGLVTIAAPPALAGIYATALPEAMTMPLADPGMPGLAGEHGDALLAALPGKKAVALGPGLGTAPTTADLVMRLYREVALPMVVDADALNILATSPERLGQAAGPRILTPHPGEMARLTGLSIREIQADRLAVARAFAGQHGVFLVLKGAATVIAGPQGQAALNLTGNSGMATAGMGDVLTGMLASLLGQGLTPWAAACLAVHGHGLAGDRLARAQGIAFGFLASELADELPRALAELQGSFDN